MIFFPLSGAQAENMLPSTSLANGWGFLVFFTLERRLHQSLDLCEYLRSNSPPLRGPKPKVTLPPESVKISLLPIEAIFLVCPGMYSYPAVLFAVFLRWERE